MQNTQYDMRNSPTTEAVVSSTSLLAPGSITIPSSKRLCPIRLAKSSGVSPRSLATNSLDFWENWPTPNGFNIHGGFLCVGRWGFSFFLLISRFQGIFLEGPSCLFRCMLSESAGKSWKTDRLPKDQDQHVSFPTLHVWIILFFETANPWRER